MHLSSATSPPLEMSPEHATIEYDLGARDDTPAAILLALDCSVRADELAHLERVVTEWLQGVSPDTPVGLVRAHAFPALMASLPPQHVCSGTWLTLPPRPLLKR